MKHYRWQAVEYLKGSKNRNAETDCKLGMVDSSVESKVRGEGRIIDRRNGKNRHGNWKGFFMDNMITLISSEYTDTFVDTVWCAQFYFGGTSEEFLKKKKGLQSLIDARL